MADMPTTISRYEIEAKLGEGGMAVVYRAWDPHMERIVALKTLLKAVDQPSIRSRFTREAKAVAKLAHPSIVPVYDFGEDNGTLFLVMQLMEGGSLSQKLAAGRLSLNGTAAILDRLCRAAAAAHRRGIIHRDIKPANILFDSQGEAYLSDFGIAKLTKEGVTSITRTGSMLGTPAYMSPEQVRGQDHIDARSDVYAIGVVLFEMLTGRPPFISDNPFGLAALHLTEPIPHLQAIMPDADLQLEQIVTRALAKSREDRFESALALRNAFRDYVLSLSKTQPAGPTHSLEQDEAESARRDASHESQDYAIALEALANGDWTRAIDHLNAVMAVEPFYRDTFALLAEANRHRHASELAEQVEHALKNSDLARASAILTQLAEAVPDHNRLAELSARFTQTKKADSLYADARVAMRDGNFDAALDTEPTNTTPFLRRSRAFVSAATLVSIVFAWIWFTFEPFGSLSISRGEVSPTQFAAIEGEADTQLSPQLAPSSRFESTPVPAGASPLANVPKAEEAADIVPAASTVLPAEMPTLPTPMPTATISLAELRMAQSLGAVEQGREAWGTVYSDTVILRPGLDLAVSNLLRQDDSLSGEAARAMIAAAPAEEVFEHIVDELDARDPFKDRSAVEQETELVLDAHDWLARTITMTVEIMAEYNVDDAVLTTRLDRIKNWYLSCYNCYSDFREDLPEYGSDERLYGIVVGVIKRTSVIEDRGGDATIVQVDLILLGRMDASGQTKRIYLVTQPADATVNGDLRSLYDRLYFAHQGPGTAYRLYDDDENDAAARSNLGRALDGQGLLPWEQVQDVFEPDTSSRYAPEAIVGRGVMVGYSVPSIFRSTGGNLSQLPFVEELDVGDVRLWSFTPLGYQYLQNTEGSYDFGGLLLTAVFLDFDAP